MPLPDCICVSGPLSEQIAQIYCAARAWTDNEDLQPCVCVVGLPLGEQLTAIYEAIYAAAADDALPDLLCVRGYPLGEQLTAIYQAILTLTGEAELPAVECVRGLPLFQQIDAIFCAALEVDLNPFDPDAEAFFEAAGTTDETQKNAVNGLVVDLKAASLWAKIVALYPFVGGAANSHSYNLKNPALYQITWVGGVVHNANGITPNGTTGYGNTNMPRTALPVVLMHLSGYVRTTNETGFHTLIGVDNFGGAGNQFTEIFHSSATYSFRNSAAGGKVDTSLVLGTIIGSRSATLDQILRTGQNVFMTAANAAPAANLALNLFVGALNRNGSATSFSNDNIALISAGAELTLAEALSFRGIVNTYQTALGRNV